VVVGHGPAEIGGERLEPGFVDIRQRELHPRRMERPRHALADTLGRTGDDAHRARETLEPIRHLHMLPLKASGS
jgi:hypothetical protein